MGIRGLKACIFFCVLLTSLQSFISSGFALDYEGRLVALVEVKGNRWIDAKTILYAVQTAPGKSYSSRLIRKDLKSVYGLGFFTVFATRFRSCQ